MERSAACTYYPKDQVIYSGAQEDLEHTRDSEYLGSMKFQAKTGATGINPEQEFLFEHVAEDLSHNKKMLTKYMAMRKQSRRGEGRFGNEMAELKAALNDSAVDQITIVQFVKQIIGQLKNVNVISRAFQNIPTNSLRGKIPEGGWPSVSVQVKRLSEPQITHTDFGQNEFRIRRNDVHIYISREDRMEAAIDPFAFSNMQGQKQLMQTRDLLALQALSSLEVNGTYGTFDDITAKDADVTVPRSRYDSTEQFLDVIVQHFTTYRNYIKYLIINPLDYRAHQTNFYTRNNIKQEPTQAFGVVPFDGLGQYGVTAIISPWVPRSVVYGLTDEGAYELDGPKIVDSDYDSKKFADYTPMRDFVGYIISNPPRFGEKINFPIAGVTSGTEITTHRQIETLLEAPDVVKNDNANSGIQ